jgi:hypothetical protein
MNSDQSFFLVWYIFLLLYITNNYIVYCPLLLNIDNFILPIWDIFLLLYITNN